MLSRAPGFPELGERTPVSLSPAAERQGRAAAPPRGGSGQGSATLRLPAPRRGAAAESPGPPEQSGAAAQHDRAEKPRRFPAAPVTTAGAPTGGRHGPGLAGQGRLPFSHIGDAATRRIPLGRSLAHGTGQGTGHSTGLLPAPPPARGAPCRAGHGAAPARPCVAFPVLGGTLPQRGKLPFSAGSSHTFRRWPGKQGQITKKSCVIVIQWSREIWSNSCGKEQAIPALYSILSLGFVVSSMSKKTPRGNPSCSLQNEIA